MKKLFFLAAVICGLPAFGQTTSGKIVYESSMAMDLSNKDLPPEIAALLPKAYKSRNVLYFAPDVSLYMNDASSKEDGKDKEYQEGNNVQIQIVNHSPETKIFIDFKNKKRVEQRDLMGRSFLISGEPVERRWKFTGRQKKIMDMPCMEATSQDGKDSISAWYTTAIPVNAGPATYWGLPGMILEVALSNGGTIKALSMDTGAETISGKIKEPSKGKKITEEAFEKLAIEKAEALKKQYGGDGNGNGVMIKTIHSR